jgi:hypothetical protein
MSSSSRSIEKNVRITGRVLGVSFSVAANDRSRTECYRVLAGVLLCELPEVNIRTSQTSGRRTTTNVLVPTAAVSDRVLKVQSHKLRRKFILAFCFLLLQLSHACAVRCLWSATNPISVSIGPGRTSRAAKPTRWDLWASHHVAWMPLRLQQGSRAVSQRELAESCG